MRKFIRVLAIIVVACLLVCFFVACDRKPSRELPSNIGGGGCVTHVDADNDGKCDVCGKDYVNPCDNHVDADGDGRCDVCDVSLASGVNVYKEPSYLAFSYTTQSPSVFKLIYIDEFDLSSILYHVVYRYENEDGEDEFITGEGKPLQEDMIDEDDREYLVTPGHHMINVSLEVTYIDFEGDEITDDVRGSFVVHLKDRTVTEFVTLTFNLNGGKAFFGELSADGTKATMQVPKDSAFSWNEFISYFPVSKKGFALKNWSNYSSQTSKITIKSDTTFDAVWTSDQINVTFDINLPSSVSISDWTPDLDQLADGAETGRWSTSVEIFNGVVARPSTAAYSSLKGHLFAGWADESGKLWDFNGKVGGEDFTLYAVWAVRTYSVTYVLMGGELKTSAELGDVAISAMSEISANVSYVNGYHEGEDGYEDSSYSYRHIVDKPFKIVVSGIKYGTTLNDYYVSIRPTVDAVKPVKLAVAPSMLNSQLTKGDDYYRVEGWYRSSSYVEEEKFDSAALDDDVVLYARWELSPDLSAEQLSKYYTEYLFRYTEKADGTIRIDQILDASISDLKVPDTVDGKTVSEIGEGAGLNLKALIALDLSQTTGLTHIDKQAFAYCINLRSITRPQSGWSIEYVGADAFVQDKILTLANTEGKYIIINNILVAYVGDGNVEEIDMSNLAIEDVNGNAIYTTTIAPGVFKGLANLKRVILPASLEKVYEEAFMNCSQLETVDVATEEGHESGRGISYVASSAFAGTKWISTRPADDASTVDVDESTFLRLGDVFYRYFNNDSATAVIPSGIKIIAPNAFSGATNVANLQFIDESAIEMIGLDAFADTKWITQDHPQVAGSNTYIQNGFVVVNGILVNYVGRQTQIDLPSGVSRIAEKAFNGYSNSNVTNIIIPADSQLTTIADNAFYGATSLKAISFLSETLALPQITSDSFSGNGAGFVSNALVFYFYADPLSQIKAPLTAADTDTALESWNSLYRAYKKSFKGLETMDARFNASVLPTLYLYEGAEVDYRAVWQAQGVGYIATIGDDEVFVIRDGAIVKRSDGVVRIEDLVVDDVIALCYEKYSTTSADNQFTLEYCDCNGLSVLRYFNGVITDYSKHADTEITQEVASAFDEVASAFDGFISNYTIGGTGTTSTLVGENDDAYSAYVDFIAKAQALFGKAIYPVPSGNSFVVKDSAVIGINNRVAFTFDSTKTEVTYDDVQQALSILFGYGNDVSTFVQRGNALAKTYHENTLGASVATVVDRLKYDGTVYTSNGYIVVPITFGDQFGKGVVNGLLFEKDSKLAFWVNDVASVFTATNKQNAVYNNDAPSKNTLVAYGRCALFENGSNIDGTPGEKTLRFYVGGGQNGNVISSPVTINVIRAIKENTMYVAQKDSNGDVILGGDGLPKKGFPQFYTTQETIPLDNLVLCFNYDDVDGTYGELPLNDAMIKITGYTPTIGEKNIDVTVNYYGLATYVLHTTCSVITPSNESIKQYDPMTVSVRSTDSSEYMNVHFLVTMTDGREITVGASNPNVILISYQDAIDENIAASAITPQSNEVGYFKMGVRYGNQKAGYVFGEVLYSVVLKTNANAFKYTILTTLDACSPNVGKTLDDAKLTIISDDCNPFVAIAQDESATLTNHSADAKISSSTYSAFNALADAYSTFSDYAASMHAEQSESADGKYEVTDGEVYQSYLTVYSRAKWLFDAANNTGNTLSASTMQTNAVVGVTEDYAITFGGENPGVVILQKAIARLFGYDDVDTFKSKASALATIYQDAVRAQTVTNLTFDGAIHAQNNTFIIPVLFKHEIKDAAIAFVVIDADENVSVCISNIGDIIRAANVYHSSYNRIEDQDFMDVTVYGRCMLFETPRRTAAVSGLASNSYDATLAIPSTVTLDTYGRHNALGGDEYTIVAIADNAFRNANKLEYVYLPTTVTSIGNNAFADCINLRQVRSFNAQESHQADYQIGGAMRLISRTAQYSATVTISHVAFDMHVTVPERIKYSLTIPAADENDCPTSATYDCWVELAPDAFLGFIGHIYLPNTEYFRRYASLYLADKNCAFYDSGERGPSYSTSFTFANYENPEVSYAVYSGDIQVVDTYEFDVLDGNIVIIPDRISATVDKTDTSFAYEYDYTVTSIGANALQNLYAQGCRELFMPSSLMSIVDIPSAETLGGDIAYYVYDANDMVAYKRSNSFSPYVTTIGNSAFSGCISLGKVDRDDNENVIGEYADYAMDMSTAVSLVKLGASAFDNCTALEEINLGNTQLTEIASMTFHGCTALREAILPSGVQHVGASAFRMCSALETIEGVSGATSIGEYAFSACTSLSEVTIGAIIDGNSIGDTAFDHTPMLATVNVLSVSCAEQIFAGKHQSLIAQAEDVYIIDSVSASASFLSLFSVDVAEGNPVKKIVTEDGVQYALIHYVKR